VGEEFCKSIPEKWRVVKEREKELGEENEREGERGCEMLP
jgi:hypothetical protein